MSVERVVTPKSDRRPTVKQRPIVIVEVIDHDYKGRPKDADEARLLPRLRGRTRR